MRRKPHFALQAVLDQRRFAEGSALRCVARCKAAYDSCARDVARLKAAIERSLQTPWFGTAVCSGDVRLQETIVATSERVARMRAEASAQAKAAFEAAREVAIEAARARRAIEILRDRQIRAFETAQRRAEELEIDEVAIFRQNARLIQFD